MAGQGFALYACKYAGRGGGGSALFWLPHNWRKLCNVRLSKTTITAMISLPRTLHGRPRGIG